MDRLAYETMAAVERDHWWFVGRRKIVRKLLTGMRLGDARILEAGCGSGGNLPLLRTFGKVEAFELDPAARAIAGVPKGRLPDDIPFEGHFDLACLFDVLEHVEDDAAALRALAARSDRLILTVPALPALWSDHDVKHHHFRRYKKAGLRARIEENGWQVERIGYFNSLLLPAAFLQRLVSPKYEGDKKPIAPLNALFSAIFSAERFLLGALPVGLSLYATARRKDG